MSLKRCSLSGGSNPRAQVSGGPHAGRETSAGGAGTAAGVHRTALHAVQVMAAHHTVIPAALRTLPLPAAVPTALQRTAILPAVPVMAALHMARLTALHGTAALQPTVIRAAPPRTLREALQASGRAAKSAGTARSSKFFRFRVFPFSSKTVFSVFAFRNPYLYILEIPK